MEITFPAFTAGGQLVRLGDVLRHVEVGRWTWRLAEFEGTAAPGSGLDVVALEQRLRIGDEAIPDPERFAARIDQPINLVLIAAPPGGTAPALTIETRDSTDWLITADDGNEEALAAARDIAAAIA